MARHESGRKIIVYIATSADGYIGRLDGSVDWLQRASGAGDYGMAEFRRSIDTIIYGRKTYDFGVEHGVKFSEKTANYVFTHDSQDHAAANVQFVKEPIADFANRLRGQRGKDVWLMGGADIIGQFVDANQVDEFIVHLMPVAIGEGVPLVPGARTLPLRLLSSKVFDDGVVRLQYAVDATR
jgi:dihydrofolate reductase